MKAAVGPKPTALLSKAVPFLFFITVLLFISGMFPSQSVSSRSDHVFLSEGVRHKLLIGSEQAELYAELLSKKAVIQDIDYGSFRMVLVDEDAVGGRSALAE